MLSAGSYVFNCTSLTSPGVKRIIILGAKKTKCIEEAKKKLRRSTYLKLLHSSLIINFSFVPTFINPNVLLYVKLCFLIESSWISSFRKKTILFCLFFLYYDFVCFFLLSFNFSHSSLKCVRFMVILIFLIESLKSVTFLGYCVESADMALLYRPAKGHNVTFTVLAKSATSVLY